LAAPLPVVALVKPARPGTFVAPVVVAPVTLVVALVAPVSVVLSAKLAAHRDPVEFTERVPFRASAINRAAVRSPGRSSRPLHVA
jgi:hypothetical protein